MQGPILWVPHAGQLALSRCPLHEQRASHSLLPVPAQQSGALKPHLPPLHTQIGTQEPGTLLWRGGPSAILSPPPGIALALQPTRLTALALDPGPSPPLGPLALPYRPLHPSTRRPSPLHLRPSRLTLAHADAHVECRPGSRYQLGSPS